MTNALVAQNGNAVAPIDGFDLEKIDLIKRTVAKGVTDDELSLFLHQAQRAGLDPLAKQIHAVTRWDTKAQRQVMSIQVAIDGYRLIADRTGLYAGSDDYLFNEGLTQYQHLQTGEPPVTATVTVYKIVAGHRVPFTATAAWDAYYPGPKQGFMWGKMPHLMLGKCAEALALRKAFPAELSGMYVREEMEQAGFGDVPTEQDSGIQTLNDYENRVYTDKPAVFFKVASDWIGCAEDDAKEGLRKLGYAALDKEPMERVKQLRRLHNAMLLPDQRPLFDDDTAVAKGAYSEA
jgi:phage recombination protein Bet